MRGDTDYADIMSDVRRSRSRVLRIDSKDGMEGIGLGWYLFVERAL